MTTVAHRSFSGGELAPALRARVDLVRYATGLGKTRNFFIKRSGGAQNRAGALQISFVLHFYNERIDVYSGGRRIRAPLNSPFRAETLSLLRYVQSGDVMTLTHPLYRPHELSLLSADGSFWSLNSLKIAPVLPPPDLRNGSGGTKNGKGWETGGSGHHDGGPTRRYRITAMTASFDESFPSDTVVAKDGPRVLGEGGTGSAFIRILWDEVPGASETGSIKKSAELSHCWA